MRPNNRREYFRIPYRPTERPRFVLGTSICEVLDCSERGLRFRPTGPSLSDLRRGAAVEGRIRLRSGAEHRVRGTVLRVEGGDASLRFDGPGIPFGSVLREQLLLRQSAPATP